MQRTARELDSPRGTRLSRAISIGVCLWLAGQSAIGLPAAAQVETPLELYGQLFVDVQLQRVFPDSKTFADAMPNDSPVTILQRYDEERPLPGFDLRAFVARNFSLPHPQGQGYRAVPGQDVCDHIDGLWSVLERRPEPAPPYASLLPLPFPYVVPGGRFTEIYYWDSYFTMLGLEQSGRRDLALDMVRNFASLVGRYGHVPNGNRTYYLSRSQPPFFAAMVDLVASKAADADAVRAEYLPALSREYAFWMDGADGLAPGSAHRRVVRLRDGTLLNRYWDDRDVPREESYREDVATAASRDPPGAGGLSRSARRGRERLGLQLALAGGRADTRDHPHDGPRAGRSQQHHGPARDGARRRPRRRRRGRAGPGARDPRRAAQGGGATPSLGRRAGRVRRLFVA